MAKASVLYLFQIQRPLSTEAQKGLSKSLNRLGLAHVYLNTHTTQAVPKEQRAWAQHIFVPFVTRHGLTLESSTNAVPSHAPSETSLWIMGAEALRDYVTAFTPGFEARDCDLVVVNTQKKQWRSLAF